MAEKRDSESGPLPSWLEGAVGAALAAAVVALLVLGFGRSPVPVDYTTPLPTTANERLEAARVQARATENAAIRNRQVAVIVAAGAALSLYLTFLNYNRERRRDADQRETDAREREHETRRMQLERFVQAVDHVKDEESELVRVAGITALRMLAEEEYGPRREVLAVLDVFEREARPAGSDTAKPIPADVEAARAARDRLSRRIYVLASSDELVEIAQLFAEWIDALTGGVPAHVLGNGQESEFARLLAEGDPDLILELIDPRTRARGSLWWPTVAGPKRSVWVSANLPRLDDPDSWPGSLVREQGNRGVSALTSETLHDLAVEIQAELMTVDAQTSVRQRLRGRPIASEIIAESGRLNKALGTRSRPAPEKQKAKD